MGYRTARVSERRNGHCSICGHMLLLLYIRPRQFVLLVVTPLGNTQLSTFIHVDVVAHSIHPRSGPVQGGTTVVVRGGSFGAPGSLGLFCSFAGSDVVAASFEDGGGCSVFIFDAKTRDAVREIELPTRQHAHFHRNIIIQNSQPCMITASMHCMW